MGKVHNRGMIRVTYDMIEAMLGLPEGVHLELVKEDGVRRIGEFYVRSEEPVADITFPTGEAQTPITSASYHLSDKRILDRMRKTVEFYDKEQA